jgi:hypothetical protein
VLGEVSAIGSRISRLGIGEARLIISGIAHGVVSTGVCFPKRAVGGVGEVLCALGYGRHVHGAREGGPGRRLGRTRVGELGGILRVRGYAR